MLRPVLVTPPATAPVSLDEMKAWLRIDDDDSNAVIDALIAAAVSHLDGWTGILSRCLITQTWAQSFDCIPLYRPFRLPLGPVQQITSITYYDGMNVEQTLDPASYFLVTDLVGRFVALNPSYSWPGYYRRDDAVTVTTVCGYGEADAVPAAIIQAIRLLVAHWFQNREGIGDGKTTELPFAVRALLTPFMPARI